MRGTIDINAVIGGYVVGKICTFHGPAGEVNEEYCCPKCGCEITGVATEEWQSLVAQAERGNPGYAAMMRWSEGKCFPDADTLQNAYRQAMEE